MRDFMKQRLLLLLNGWGWYRNPKEIIRVKGHELLVTKGAFYRSAEKDDAWLYLLAKKHQFIVDVGCNIGQSAVLMAVGNCNRFLCIDANAKALSLCAENLIFNGLSDRTILINTFVGDREGDTISFHTLGAGAAGSMFSGFAKTATRLNQSFTIRTRTLEGICRDCNFLPDMIKIDVEGAECLVLHGIGKEILAQKPSIFVEVHSGKELDIVTNTQQILDWCCSVNYAAHYVTHHVPLQDPEQIRSRGRYHLLLLPVGAEYPTYLNGVPESCSLNSDLLN